MLDMNQWLTDYQKAMNATFGDRVLFIGLQGSYARGEATDTSDIDVDALTALYKAAFFVLQAKHFCETSKYVNRRAKLADCLVGDDLAILLLSGQPGAITTDNLSEATARLLHWSSALIRHNRDCGEI